MGALRLNNDFLKVVSKNLGADEKKCVNAYSFGFQGQEKDDEVFGSTGTALNYKYRMHDARIGRFFAVDPLAPKYPHNSPYAFSENVVINAVELEGREKSEVSKTTNGTTENPNGGATTTTESYSGTVYGPYIDENAVFSEIENGNAKLYDYSYSFSTKTSTPNTSTSSPLMAGELATATSLAFEYGYKRQVQLFNKGYFEGQTLKGVNSVWKQTYNGGNGVGSVKAMKSSFNKTASTGKGLFYSKYTLNGITGVFIGYDAMTNPEYGEGFGGKYNEGTADVVGWGLGFSNLLFPISMAYFKVKPTLKVADDDQVTKASLYTGYRPIPKGFGPDKFEEIDRILDSLWDEKTRKGQTRSATW